MKRIASLGMALALAGCGGAVVPKVQSAGTVAVPYTSAGLERVIGRNGGELIALFGQPDADVREGTARKLQFGSNICVLDAYLYPKGQAEPKVTYVDAREPDGSAIDRASCVAALTRREGGK